MSHFFDSHARPLGLQLYTLGELPQEDFEGVLAQVAATGFRDLELPGLYGRAPADISAACRNAGLNLSCVHMAPTANPGDDSVTLQSDPNQIIDHLGALGITQAVVPIAPVPDTFAPPENGEDIMMALSQSFVDAGADYWKGISEFLNERSAPLKAAGITVGYHNHNFEFAPLGDESGWDILVRETDPDLVSFEIDTGWVAAAGLDPVEFLQKHSGRVRWLHLKEVATATKQNYALAMSPTEVGSGTLNWPAILETADRIGVKHYYLEQEAPFELPRLESIRQSHAYLSQL